MEDMYPWYEAQEFTEEVATRDYEVPLGCFLCGGPHMSTDCQVGNPFAESRSEQMQYEGYVHYQQNDPYLSSYNPGWSNHSESHWSNQQEHQEIDPALEDMILKFMSKMDERMDSQDEALRKLEAKLDQVAQHTQAATQRLEIQISKLATDIQWQEHEPYPMVQCNETAVEIKEQNEHQIWVDQVETEGSQNLFYGDDTSTLPEPLELCLVHSATAKEESHQDTYVSVDLGEGKPKPPPPFEQNPHLGSKEIPSHSRYAVLGESSSLPVIWLGWCGKLMRRYQLWGRWAKAQAMR
ncbi:hypothetical protein ACOSQ3_007313 [Xanthoceras sorbifolium]